jgi:acetyltransferase-like isoleucine patch superfamily enzyme
MAWVSARELREMSETLLEMQETVEDACEKMSRASGREYCRIAPDVKLGEGVRIFSFVNLYGCSIGDNSKIGAFVEIQKNAEIGRSVKVSSHTFICEGVRIEDNVFIGHNVSFINDKYPRATNADGTPQTEADWSVVETVVKQGASIGTGSTILCGVTIGEFAIVGAGSVVTKDVPPYTVVAGSPARFLKKVERA